MEVRQARRAYDGAVDAAAVKDERAVPTRHRRAVFDASKGPNRASLMMLSIVAEAWREREAAEKSSREDGEERVEG